MEGVPWHGNAARWCPENAAKSHEKDAFPMKYLFYQKI